MRKLAVGILGDTSRGAIRLRSQFGIAVGTAADVAIVQDATVCEAATASLESKGWPRQPEAVVVVRLAQSSPFYLASQRLPGGTGNIYLLDSQLAVLAEFGGH